ncbi:MAG: hypothetical protein LBN12_06280, partial [Clostridiales Family XIII bacterium]|nr:hypothetical protein [Clostridiales Family XIII bacterium]
MSKTVSAKSANNGNAIEFASDAGAVRFARCIRSGGYVRVLRGAAADADWWERLRPDERYFFRCVMQAKLRPELVLTKLSAAAVYGARLRVEPQKVLCAAAPGADPSRIMLGRTKSTPLPAGVKLVYQSVTVQPDGSYTVGKAMKPSRAKKDGESGGRGTNGMDGADGTGNSPSERTRRSGTSVVVACTSLTRTIYDIAAAYPLEDSMIVINSLLSERASKHRVLAKENRLSEKGALCAHLCRMAVSDMLGAKSYAAFREAAEPYRQHGLKYEYA